MENKLELQQEQISKVITPENHFNPYFQAEKEEANFSKNVDMKYRLIHVKGQLSEKIRELNVIRFKLGLPPATNMEIVNTPSLANILNDLSILLAEAKKVNQDLNDSQQLGATEVVPSTVRVLENKITNTKTAEEERLKSFEYQVARQQLNLEKELSFPVRAEAREMRNALFEGRGLFQLSKEDFETYFASRDFEIGAEIQQQNVGDCYAVAALHAISKSPHFEMICRSAVRRLEDGSWEVRVPFLGSPHSKYEKSIVVIIKPEELLSQKNRNYLKKVEDGNGADFREELHPMKGKEGMKALEAAYIKQKFGTVDRLLAEGGKGGEVLMSMGGDAFECMALSSARYNQDTKKREYPGLNTLNSTHEALLDHYLENFDPEIHIATVSTKKFFGMSSVSGILASITGFYKSKGALKFFVPGHAYSVSKVDTEKRTIFIVNPWNTSKSIELSFEQFKSTFAGIDVIKINSAKLLKNMMDIAEQPA